MSGTMLMSVATSSNATSWLSPESVIDRKPLLAVLPFLHSVNSMTLAVMQTSNWKNLITVYFYYVGLARKTLLYHLFLVRFMVPSMNSANVPINSGDKVPLLKV